MPNPRQTCDSCGIEKPLSEFRKTKCGHRKKCRTCNKIDHDNWKQNNKEHIKEYNAKYFQANKEDIVEAHRERIAGYGKEWKLNRAEYQRKRYYTEANYHILLKSFNSHKDVWDIEKIKKIAHKLVDVASRIGVITKSGICSRCGSTHRIHGHHTDYYKPLEIIELCERCHFKEHARLRKENHGKS